MDNPRREAQPQALAVSANGNNHSTVVPASGGGSSSAILTVGAIGSALAALCYVSYGDAKKGKDIQALVELIKTMNQHLKVAIKMNQDVKDVKTKVSTIESSVDEAIELMSEAQKKAEKMTQESANKSASLEKAVEKLSAEIKSIRENCLSAVKDVQEGLKIQQSQFEYMQNSLEAQNRKLQALLSYSPYNTPSESNFPSTFYPQVATTQAPIPLYPQEQYISGLPSQVPMGRPPVGGERQAEIAKDLWREEDNDERQVGHRRDAGPDRRDHGSSGKKKIQGKASLARSASQDDGARTSGRAEAVPFGNFQTDSELDSETESRFSELLYAERRTPSIGSYSKPYSAANEKELNELHKQRPYAHDGRFPISSSSGFQPNFHPSFPTSSAGMPSRVTHPYAPPYSPDFGASFPAYPHHPQSQQFSQRASQLPFYEQVRRSNTHENDGIHLSEGEESEESAEDSDGDGSSSCESSPRMMQEGEEEISEDEIILNLDKQDVSSMVGNCLKYMGRNN